MRFLIGLLGLLLWAMPAQAAVEITFRSKDFGASFPHAFVVLSGTVDETGEAVDTNYGFTVRHLIGPSVLFGRVQGIVESVGDDYVEHSNRHFTMVLTDAEFRSVIALVERWQNLPQPSYSLDRNNCVSFVADVARLLGLEADTRGVMRRPRAFLDRVRDANATVIAARSAAPAEPRVAAPAPAPAAPATAAPAPPAATASASPAATLPAAPTAAPQ